MRSLPPSASAPRSTLSTSALMISTSPMPALRAAMRGTRSRSSSITVSLPHWRNIGRVMAPSPGPISTMRWPGCGATAWTMRAMISWSCRKCWPKRLRRTCGDSAVRSEYRVTAWWRVGKAAEPARLRHPRLPAKTSTRLTVKCMRCRPSGRLLPCRGPMPLSALIRLLLLGMIWGASFLFQRITVPVVGASFTAAIRLALSAAMLVFVLRLLGRSLDLRRQWRAWLWLGTISAALPFLCFAYAARSLPAGYMAVINATVPLLTVIFAALLWRVRASWSKRIGVVVGLIGVGVLARYGSLGMNTQALLAIGLCFVASALYAYSSLFIRQHHANVNPLVLAAA